MNRSLLAFTLVLLLGFGAWLAAIAHSEPSETLAQPPQSPEQSAEMPYAGFKTYQSDRALQDYQANINPNSNVPTTGIYDQGDRFRDATGRPLPGWGSVSGAGAGDN
jgi:hypothetical protein